MFLKKSQTYLPCVCLKVKEKISMFFFALTRTHCTHCGFFFFSQNVLLSTILTLWQHFFFSFLHFTTWNKASQFFLDLCILQKLCRENSNLVVSILGVTPKQKSHFSLLVLCPILLFFSSFHRGGPLGQNHQNSLQNCLFIRLQIKFFDI